MKQFALNRFGIDEIISLYKDKPVIKVLQGIRRCGKSFMLELLAQKMIQSGVNQNQIVLLNFEDFENVELLDSKKLYDYIKKRNESADGKKVYLFLDEIQEVADWEKVVNSIYSSTTVDSDIYITGSNANLLSSELATYLSGRYVLIHVWPLSYREFLYFNSERDSPDAFKKFIEYGGFPGLKDMMENPVQIHSYLEGIYSTVLLKDVISRNKIRDTGILEKIILYIADNVGNIFSAKRISDFMKNGGRSLSVETIYNDLEYLKNALVLYKVPRYDLRGKKILETMEKYYLADQGLLSFLHGFKDTYINGILENIVYIELLRRGYKVFIGKIRDAEIDFVVEKGGERIYIQVAYLITTEEIKEREIRPLKSLLALGDNFPKLILTMDELPVSNENGIVRKNIREWILDVDYDI
ncbi:ATP-binding protein [Treponema pectinovorum]|uniref:ATP-binding protein n=1 Tax=Treponema pectinovorum TaxID=164 RepID=UPI0011C6EFBA|nr:ATP-binding protein [Treponema pectinovorum]